MALTEMQKKIINDNPTTSPTDLAKMVGCNPKTITRHRNQHKNKDGQKTDIIETKDGQNEGQSLACAREQNECLDISFFDKIRKSNLILSPDDLFKLGTTVCVQEFAMYSLATVKLSTDPDNTKYLWTQKQHREGVERMVSMMGKWHGMDKTTLDINVKNDLLTEKDIDNMSFDDITTVVIDQCQRKQ